MLSPEIGGTQQHFKHHNITNKPNIIPLFLDEISKALQDPSSEKVLSRQKRFPLAGYLTFGFLMVNTGCL